MKMTDREQTLLSDIIEDHLWRQYNFLKGSSIEHQYEDIKKEALKLKKKYTNFIID